MADEPAAGINEAEKREWDFLVREYAVVESKWRFFQGLRYAILGGIGAILGSLFAVYLSIFNSFQDKKLDLEPAQIALAILSFTALVIVAAGLRLEQRLRYLYSECSNRGMKIEQGLGIVGAIFTVLDKVPRGRLLPHTMAVQLVAIVVGLGWIALFYNAATLKAHKEVPHVGYTQEGPG